MSALIIATITIKDFEKFQQYLAKTQLVAAHYGAKLLVRGKADRSLTDHDKDHSLVVILRFPGLEKVNEWIDSEEYQSLIPLRDEGTEMKMTSYEVISKSPATLDSN